jgi:transcriptional regulator with XRE-family HTH domain
VIQLKVDKAISEKINKILIERNLTINKLATISCLTQSTVESLVNGRSKNPKLLTIMKICDGLNISLDEFFDDEIFNNIDN